MNECFMELEVDTNALLNLHGFVGHKFRQQDCARFQSTFRVAIILILKRKKMILLKILFTTTET